MAKDPNPVELLNETAEQFMEKSTQQARGAMENYVSLLQQSFSLSPWMKTDFGEKLRSYAERNVAAARQYVEQLSQAKTLQDIVRIQTEFTQTQLNSFVDQTKAMGEAYMKAMASAVKPPF